MGFLNNLFGRTSFQRPKIETTDKTLIITAETCYKEYALAICMNKIANALTQCTFETYNQREKLKADIWYTFNIEPNKNQNASDFWNAVVFNMVTNPQGCLIVQNNNGDFLVADSYTLEEFPNSENIYSEVTIGDYTFTKKFKESEVLRLKLNNSSVKYYIEDVYNSYGKLITTSIKNYNRNNSKKLFLKIGTTFAQLKTKVDPETGESEYDTTLDDIFKNRMRGYFSENDSVTPIEDGLEIVSGGSTSNNDTAKKSNGQTTDDIRRLFDDILNICADAFNIPRGLLKGDVADVEAMTDNFITFGMNPIASLIEDEINRKLYGKDEILKGSKIKVKTNTIKGYDPLKLASSAEALYRIGSVNSNWVRDMLREEEISEDWANMYMITKNYQEISNYLKGGESDGNEN
ncbi:phage portal protein [Clostridioides mangenotii]|uniref:phage portal protein n=1 Tax=Metaclostridioides mangenotii TaxID=1540 RepID=UPI001C0FD55C|nr:phage portal protein [Clostridioides mangenotii]